MADPAKTDRPGATISVKNISFGFNAPLFRDFSLDLGGESPTAILGSSGCGKTTLLRLLAGLLRPQAGSIESQGSASFVFQENRLLPWYTVLENVSLPAEGMLGKEKARERARYFLHLVSLEDKAASYPQELSGGQGQRASIARAFAYPASIIFMDEPFQSLDIPLRLRLMDTVLSLLEIEKRLTVTVTHDPREAIYLGRRILVLGNAGGATGPKVVIFDEAVDLSPEDRAYGSPVHSRLEGRLLKILQGRNHPGVNGIIPV